MSALQITFRDVTNTPAVEAVIRKKAEKLKLYYDRVISCHVVIELDDKHKSHGKRYNVRVDIRVPGKDLVSTRKCDEDVYVALRDAFAALSRQLEEHSRKRQGRVKSHNHVMHGTVVRMVTDDGYGFIEGRDGHEYYFSVTNMCYPQFDKLEIGDVVEYTPEPTKDGQHAQHIVRERHGDLMDSL